MDVVLFLANSVSEGADEMFSARKDGMKNFVLTARKVRGKLKENDTGCPGHVSRHIDFRHGCVGEHRSG